MALTFPTYFPQPFLPPVVKAAAKAEREFRADVKAAPLGDVATAKRAATKYIMTVALIFAHQACEAARAGDPHVAVSGIAWYIEDFLRRVSVHVYHELTDRNVSHRCGSWESFEREMQSAVMESPGWVEDHLAERAAVADDDAEALKAARDAKEHAVPSPAEPEARREVFEQQARQHEPAVNPGAPEAKPVDRPGEKTDHGLAEALSIVDRRARIDAFIQSVRNETGRKIKRKDIWRVAGYTEATEFERFQRGEGNSGSIAKFSKVLRLRPSEFLERLDRPPEK